MPQTLSDEEWTRLQSELQRLQGRAQIADFIEPIYNDPLLSDRAKALIKEKYPNVQIPDYELKQQFTQGLDEVKKLREDDEKKRAQAEQQQKWDQEKKRVQEDFGFTEDGMKDLEKYMVDNNIGNYQIAAEHHAMKNPKQSDATQHNGRWAYQKQDGFADIAKDPEGWAENEILGALRRDQERAKGGWR